MFGTRRDGNRCLGLVVNYGMLNDHVSPLSGDPPVARSEAQHSMYSIRE